MSDQPSSNLDSRFEKPAIAFALLLLTIFATLFVRYFYQNYDVTSEASYASNLPVQGESCQIKTIDTYWKEDPITKQVFPYATIHLAPLRGKSVALRLVDGVCSAAGRGVRSDEFDRADNFRVPLYNLLTRR